MFIVFWVIFTKFINALMHLNVVKLLMGKVCVFLKPILSLFVVTDNFVMDDVSGVFYFNYIKHLLYQ